MALKKIMNSLNKFLIIIKDWDWKAQNSWVLKNLEKFCRDFTNSLTETKAWLFFISVIVFCIIPPLSLYISIKNSFPMRPDPVLDHLFGFSFTSYFKYYLISYFETKLNNTPKLISLRNILNTHFSLNETWVENFAFQNWHILDLENYIYKFNFMFIDNQRFLQHRISYNLYIIFDKLLTIFWQFIFAFLSLIPILLLIAYATLLERKILSSSQKWWGPNKVGLKGSLQPVVDGIKLILKELIIPIQSESKIFFFSAVWTIWCMLLLWFIIPTSKYGGVLEFDYELLALFCVSIIGSISVLLAGWSSNSKYSFLGGVWAGAQMISYELTFGLLVLIIMTVVASTQIIDIINFQIWFGWLFMYLPIETIMFLIIIIAETNWAPFDFAEAESELVSGYNTEYSGLPFAFFFIAEYGNILYMSLLSTLFFFGGWLTPFFGQLGFCVSSFILFFKIICIYFFFLWLRAAFPWFWYDQLMSLCWKIFLPLALILLIFWISSNIYLIENNYYYRIFYEYDGNFTTDLPDINFNKSIQLWNFIIKEYLEEALKQTQELLPNIENQELLPNIENQELLPNIENQELLPNIENQELLPNIENQELLPNIENQELLPNIENQELLPNIENQELLPNIENQELLPNIENQELLPNIELN